MLLIISDASVLIDIECGELTNAMFSLPWQFVVPDTLFDEELAERHGHLSKLKNLAVDCLGARLKKYIIRTKATILSQEHINALNMIDINKLSKCDFKIPRLTSFKGVSVYIAIIQS